MEFLLGLMVDAMKVTMLMIKKRVKESFSGQTEENTKEDGEMESNMESEHIHLLAVKPSRENGKKVRGFIGFQTMEKIDERQK